MALTVKICGLRDARTLDAALDAGADMVGFVSFERSPRHLPEPDAKALAARVEGRAKKVLLTADAGDADLAAALRAVAPDLLQLHGGETPKRVQEIRLRFGVPVMRAIGVSTREDLARVAAFDAVSDWLLFDARPPAGSSRPGGNAVALDWRVLRGLSTRCRWLLAGGLTAGNVGEALAVSGARGIDVSSGVETALGRKDAALIQRFIAAARAEERSGCGDVFAGPAATATSSCWRHEDHF